MQVDSSNGSFNINDEHTSKYRTFHRDFPNFIFILLGNREIITLYFDLLERCENA